MNLTSDRKLRPSSITRLSSKQRPHCTCDTDAVHALLDPHRLQTSRLHGDGFEHGHELHRDFLAQRRHVNRKDQAAIVDHDLAMSSAKRQHQGSPSSDSLESVETDMLLRQGRVATQDASSEVFARYHTDSAAQDMRTSSKTLTADVVSEITKSSKFSAKPPKSVLLVRLRKSCKPLPIVHFCVTRRVDQLLPVSFVFDAFSGGSTTAKQLVEETYATALHRKSNETLVPPSCST